MTSPIATYRCPREGNQPSRVLALYQGGLNFRMTGGKFGEHTLTSDSKARVIAHWNGYVSATRGRDTKPARPVFREMEVKQ